MKITLLLFLILCASCQKCPQKVPPFTWQEINGQDEIIAYGQRVRRPVYRAQVPIGWQRIGPSENESIRDTTKPIVSFTIEEGVTLMVHTFPTASLEERIPPEVHVQRWQGQLKGMATHVSQTAHGDFAGLYLEGYTEKGAVRAWSLQLDMQHYQTLHFLATTVEEEEHYQQMAADYTLKAFGPKEKLEKHHIAIDLFANSFELIQEIPTKI